jgi:hypothetical protein
VAHPRIHNDRRNGRASLPASGALTSFEDPLVIVSEPGPASGKTHLLVLFATVTVSVLSAAAGLLVLRRRII